MIAIAFTFQYVSIKTVVFAYLAPETEKFTFQYVSIKTAVSNSTYHALEEIYIPICFY